MSNKTLLDAMKEVNNQGLTENGGKTYTSSMNPIIDLFSLGGSYRTRSEEDCILLFKKAFDVDKNYAMKCLFYLGDVRGGQGERRFFRVICHWLAINETEIMRRNLIYVPEYTRWDNLYTFVGTPLEAEAFKLMYHQLALDVKCKTPSLLAKWLKSENTSSNKSRELATKTREAFHMTPKEYRKTLSTLRERIRVLERLMSAGRWDEIEFDRIPSRAGLIYRNAFARRDILKEKYEKFAKDTTTKVNAGTLYPCDVVRQARGVRGTKYDDTERLMINKYWENLTDYFKDAVFNGVAVVDTSGSMTGWGTENSIRPIDVAVSLGMYCAEKCNPKSPWYGHYITFSREARLVPVEGIDFVDKVQRIVDANLCENTNIRSVFDLLLNLAIGNNIAPADMPQNIVVISDMEFDRCATFNYTPAGWYKNNNYKSEMEVIAREWKDAGYEMPNLIFWNVQARQDNIPMKDNGRVTFVSGYSPVIYEMLMKGKSGWDLIKQKLDSERYAPIH